MKKEFKEAPLDDSLAESSKITKKSSSSIKAVIFDMDGVLIDSEPFWREAEIAVFKQVGVELTESMCYETMGLRVDEIVDYWYGKNKWKNFVAGKLEGNIIDEVIKRILSNGKAKDGAKQAIEFFKGKGLKIALASSSPYRIIRAVVERLEIADEFDCVYSAEEEEYGKPHPGVYINTALKLCVNASECLAIEDSFNGVLAAKAAKMKCVAIPEGHSDTDPRFVIADMILDSLLKCVDMPV